MTGNIAKLGDLEKVDWFRARHEHVFLRPQRAFWVDENVLSRLLASLHPGYRRVRSAKLVMLGGLANACESIGSFIIPAYTGKDKNWRRFERFVVDHMSSWKSSLQMPGVGSRDLVRLLWDNYRNGI